MRRLDHAVIPRSPSRLPAQAVGRAVLRLLAPGRVALVLTLVGGLLRFYRYTAQDQI